MLRRSHFIALRRGIMTTVFTVVLCLFMAACSTSHNTEECRSSSLSDSYHAANRLDEIAHRAILTTDTATILGSLYDCDSTAIRRQGDTVRVVEHWHTVVDRRTSSLNSHSRDTSSVVSASTAFSSSAGTSVAAVRSRTVSSSSFLSSLPGGVVTVVAVVVIFWLWIQRRD
jgi:hypothetical protein